MSDKNRQIVLMSLPEDELKLSHFKLEAVDHPKPGPGELLIQTLYMSLDAANRSWLQSSKHRTYRSAVSIGDVMPTLAIGRVVASSSPSVPVGTIIETEGEWADYCLVQNEKAKPIPDTAPLSHRLSVLGIAGKTAYFGLLHLGDPKPGETLVVSAAAGSVGTLVGQIGKLKDCRVVGIAGGREKCAWLVDELGFDAAVDYKAGPLAADLKAACPDGIDIYFDNVGGKVLETVLFQMNLKGRIVCCGVVSQYNTKNPVGPRNLPGLLIAKRLRMEGFIALDFREFEAQAEVDLADWVQRGQLTVIEDIIDGLENAPRALIGLLNGENRGKRMIRVAD
ncbi:MAG: NADP-dependent oxidoreductase [Henriciella sp.]